MESSRTEGPALLVDGTGLLMRCTKAGMRTGLSSQGVATGPLMMFITSLSRVIRENQPTDIAVCFDGENGQAWRRDIWPEYKRDRAPCRFKKEGDFLFIDFCSRAGMGPFLDENWEADDQIAAAWRTYRRAGRHVVICADDADYHQLLDERTWQVMTRRNQPPWTCQDVWDHYGCSPLDLATLRALAGDPADGIPGVPGVGPRTALRLLAEPLPAPAQTYRRLIDLITPERAPDRERPGYGWWGQEVPRMPWQPERAAPVVLPFLRRYELARLAEKLEAGKLW